MNRAGSRTLASWAGKAVAGLHLSIAALFCLLSVGAVYAQSVTPGAYYWYVPEHEKYGRTAFYSIPSFSSGMVRVTRTQRFKVLGAQKGWVALEFDVAGKAYVHLRILRNQMYDPLATDPWYEFTRASVFSEEPAKVEARVKAPAAPTATVTDSKTPAWKRYKEGWNLKPTRTQQVTPETGDGVASTTPTTSPAPEKKSRNKYPLLPPIGSEPPPAGATDPEAAPGDTTTAPAPQ
jgi:hypothetical protein